MTENHVGGLWCREVLERLDAYVDGLLEPAELVAVQAHVQGCDQCARFGGAYARVVGALRSQSTETLGEARTERLLARLTAERP